MAESTLNLPMADLKSEIGSFLGWGRAESGWSASKIADINACLTTALRKFYFGAQTNPKEAAHTWTFLKPVATIHVPVSTGLDPVPLPDDFGGFEGLVTVSNDGNGGAYWPAKQRHEEQIRAMYSACPTTTGRPQAYAEVQNKGTTPTRSNRSSLWIWPITDAAYFLQVPYYILPDALTALNPWCYGGAGHAETMKAAARSAAELYLDTTPGPETANYMQCLSASISFDRRHQPKSLGVNTDRSDWRGAWRQGWPSGLWEPLGIGYLDTASFQ